MAQTGFADTILEDRPRSQAKSDPLASLSITSASKPNQEAPPGYQLYRKPGFSLILERANGDMLAPEYTYLVRKELLRSEGRILLYFTDCFIELKGRNLSKLFLYLCQHSVASILEIPPEEDNFSDDQPIINEILAESFSERA